MAQLPLRFTVQLVADPLDPAKRLSGAFALPGVRVVGALRSDGSAADEPVLRDGALLVAPGVEPVAYASLEVPSDLVAQSGLDEQKFVFEKDKARSEDENKRRTLLWSFGSAALTAAVTLGAAFINKGETKAPSGGASADAVQACRTSLKRLPLLAKSNGQTVQVLAEAIDRHEAECDEVLVKTLGTR